LSRVRAGTKLDGGRKEVAVTTVRISRRYGIVIPREVRESLGIRPGEKLEVFQYRGRIEFVPVRKMRDMRGAFKGIDTTVPRERDRG
jgi:AbrB family looped-hinge helix DNA binding protein